MSTRRTRPLSILSILVALVIAGVFFVHGQLTNRSEPGNTTSTATSMPVQLAATNPLAADFNRQEIIALAAALPVTDHPQSGYDRDLFGQAWADVDHNGCNTRNDILARDLVDTTIDTDNCTVLSGTLHDPYTGSTITFHRGTKTSAAVQIDHLVPLAAAWRGGAASWSDQERLAFANDPANLVAVDGPSNTSKSDQLPGEWLPENQAIRCAYTAAITQILTNYQLAVSSTDKTTLQQYAKQCATG